MLKLGKNNFFSIMRFFLSYFLFIFFSAFSTMPIKFFYDIKIFPNLASMFVLYFFIINTQEVSYFSLFIFGLFFDIFNNFPLGTTSFVWLISAKFIVFLRQHFYKNDDFITIFRDFFIFTLINLILQWVLFSILYKIYYPILNSVLQFFLDLLLFAVLYKAFRKMEQILI